MENGENILNCGKRGIVNHLFIVAIVLIFPLLVFLKGPSQQVYSAFEIAIWLIMLFFFVLASQYKNRRNIPPLYAIAILLFVVYQVLISIGSRPYLNAVTSLLIHNKYILISFLVPVFIISRRDEEFLLIGFVSVSLIVVYYVVYKFMRNPQLLQVIESKSREMSVFPNSSMLGVYLATIFFLQILLVDMMKRRSIKVASIILIILPSLLVMIVAFSRRAWMAFLLSFFLYFLLHKKKRLVLSVVALLFLIVFVRIDYQSVTQRFMLSFDSSFESNTIRLEQAAESFELINRSVFYMIGGLGAGAVGPAVTYSENNNFKQVDSYILQLILEYGIVGLFLYLVIFGVVCFLFVKTYKNYRQCNDTRLHFSLAYFLSLLVLFTAGFAGSTPITFPLNLLQWMLFGLILRHYEISKSVIFDKKLFADMNR